MNEKLSFIVEFKEKATAGLKKVKKSTDDAKKSVDGLKKETSGLKKALGSISGAGKKAFGGIKNTASNALSGIKNSLKGLGPAIAGAFAVAGVASFGKEVLSVGMEFDSMMSEVQALSGTTGDNLDKLRDKAKELGSTTKFSATQSAEAFKFMSRQKAMDTHIERCA